jgi:hypothetical protein
MQYDFGQDILLRDQSPRFRLAELMLSSGFGGLARQFGAQRIEPFGGAVFADLRVVEPIEIGTLFGKHQKRAAAPRL